MLRQVIQIYSATHNDLGQIVIVCPYPLNHNLYLISNKIKIIFKRYLCSHGNSTVFVLDDQPYIEKIKIQIDNLDAGYINLHKYESYKGLTLLSTIVRNEDEYIIQWIEYHLILGIDKFIIYDNSGNKNDNPSSGNLLGKGKNSSLYVLLSNYVDSGRVIILDWPFDEKFQETHQNHSIWAFKSAKYIGFFDVDEYINPQMNDFYIPEILDQYLMKNKLNFNEIGGLRFANRFFYNPFNCDDSGYNFLTIYNTDFKFTFVRGKSFILPSNVNCYSVHEISNGEKWIDVNYHLIYFNHYFFLNKLKRARGIFNFTFIRDKSIKRYVKMLKKKDI